jgi:hypothetical protein
MVSPIERAPSKEKALKQEVKGGPLVRQYRFSMRNKALEAFKLNNHPAVEHLAEL